MLRRTRTGTQYLASVAVIWTEAIKLGVCIAAQGAECARTASQRGLGFRQEALHQASEILGRSWPMLVPAALFVMQQVRYPFCSLFLSCLGVRWQGQMKRWAHEKPESPLRSE
jgi:hypothetical protein